jgi:hypothetical protein
MENLGQYIAARPAVHRAALALFCLCVIIGLSIGLSRIMSEASSAAQDARASQERFASSWHSRIGTRFTEGGSLAAAAGAFAAAGATHVPNHNGTVAERIQFINNASWAIVAGSLFDQVPGMLALQLQPSGIIAQTWPPGSAPIGLDVWNQASTRAAYVAMVEGKKTITNGPVGLAQGGLGVLVRFPVFLGPEKRFEDWWGAGVAVIRVSDMLRALDVEREFVANGYEFVCYARKLKNATSVPEVILQSDKSQVIVESKDSLTLQLPTSDPENGLFLTVYARQGLPTDSPAMTDVLAVAFGTLGAGLALVLATYLVVVVAFFIRHSVVPHKSTAAKETPMCLVAVQRIGWWTEHQEPGQLHDDLTRFERVTADLASKFGCHCSGRISDGCVLVVAQKVEALYDFAAHARDALPLKLADVASHSREGKAAGGSRARSEGTQETKRTIESSRRPAARRGVQAQVSHLRDNSAASESQTRSNMSGNADATFEFGITLHSGPLRCAYNAENDAYTFYGTGIALAATAVDATHRREVTATEDFVTHVRERVLANAVARILESGETILVVAHDGEAGAKRNSKTNINEASVATAVSAKSGTIVRKRVGILAFDVLPPNGSYDGKSRDPAIAKFGDLLEQVSELCGSVKGELACIHDTRFVMIFNAMVPVSAPARRAAHADAMLRARFPNRQIVSVVTHGFCHVASLHSGVVALGDAARRARVLLDEVLVLQAAHRCFDRTAFTENVTAEELRQSCEMQCYGPLEWKVASISSIKGANSSTSGGAAGTPTAPPTLLFAVEREWLVDEEDDEWLYRLQKFEAQSPFTPLNAAFEAVVSGNTTVADTCVKDVRARSRDKSVYAPYALQRLYQLSNVSETASHSNGHDSCPPLLLPGTVL